MSEISNMLHDEPSFFVRMLAMHPNQCAELAANELLVREIKKEHYGTRTNTDQ
jgi:hypothetical protein